ncbi:MAG: hypothetical protein ACLGG7_00455 [Bacteriovoracia bacterium]
MGKLSDKLKEIQVLKGHHSAKSFYQTLANSGLECNYPYFMRILQGTLLPSSEIVHQIAKITKTHLGEEVIKAFCQDQFPDFDHLFPVTETKAPQKQKSALVLDRKSLTVRQVHIIGKSVVHYHVFVLLTLARTPIEVRELSQLLKEKNLEAVMTELEEGQILVREGTAILAAFPDVTFPKDSGLGPLYQKMDEWDVSFGDRFNLETVIKRMQIRRISWRYLNLIEAQLNLALEMIRSADELDTKHNDHIIHLQLTLKQGKVPG